jgi:peptidoglycan/xylan/chitin deacetylase (PgdA/CDA1 family)
MLAPAAIPRQRPAALPVEGAELNLEHPQPDVLVGGTPVRDAIFELTRTHVVAILARGHKQVRVLWDEGESHPRMMSVGLHARYAGQPSRASAVRDFIEYALEKGDVWFARRIDIANWWIEHHEEFEGAGA